MGLTLSFTLSLLFSLVLSFLLWFIYLKIGYSNLESWQTLIISLGLYIILENVISIIWGNSTISFRSLFENSTYELLEIRITFIQLITILVSVTALLFTRIWLVKTKLGNMIRAVSSNPSLSVILGINKERVILVSFLIGGLLASLSGILIAADRDMTPNFGFNWLLYALVAMIIGGLGKLRFIVLGSLFLAATQQFSAFYLNSKWMNAITFIILVVFLYFKPYGFSGQKLRKIEI